MQTHYHVYMCASSCVHDCMCKVHNYICVHTDATTRFSVYHCSVLCECVHVSTCMCGHVCMCTDVPVFVW